MGVDGWSRIVRQIHSMEMERRRSDKTLYTVTYCTIPARNRESCQALRYIMYLNYVSSVRNSVANYRKILGGGILL